MGAGEHRNGTEQIMWAPVGPGEGFAFTPRETEAMSLSAQ